MSGDQALKSKVDAFPQRPGVYLMKNAANEVIYVGKAADLRGRVRSYFQKTGQDERLIESRFSEVSDIDFVVTGSPLEALMLESNFIKQFRPKYNVVLRDDKSYISIAIDLDEPWPRPVLTRRLGRKGTKYFGPYGSAKAARRMFRTIQDVFPLRRCTLRECTRRSRPCQYAEMGKCLGPCTGGVTEAEYREIVDEVMLFLKGGGDELLARLEKEMRAAAGAEEFEKAARIRDRMAAIRRSLEKQVVASSDSSVNRDVFGVTTAGRHAHVAVLLIRDGNLSEVSNYRYASNLDSPAAALGSFIQQFYAAQSFIPDEVLLPLHVPDQALIEQWLTARRGRKVEVSAPERGDRRRLVELAVTNTMQAADISLRSDETSGEVLEAVRSALGLRAVPRRIECFDVSTLSGDLAVGSMSVYLDGRPAKDQYRRYRIQTVSGQDDFAMLREVLRRRVRRGVDEGTLPDLMVIDGGRGQLSAVLAALGEAGLEGQDVVALAKERTRAGRKVRVERVFVPGRSDPIPLDPHTRVYQILTGIRDEAHRFAIAYHRRLRSRPLKGSPMQEIPGVGPALARALVKRFGGVQGVREATAEQLAAVPGIGPRKARRIREHFDLSDGAT